MSGDVDDVTVVFGDDDAATTYQSSPLSHRTVAATDNPKIVPAVTANAVVVVVVVVGILQVLDRCCCGFECSSDVDVVGDVVGGRNGGW